MTASASKASAAQLSEASSPVSAYRSFTASLMPAVSMASATGKVSPFSRLKALQQTAGERIMGLAEVGAPEQRNSALPSFFRLTSEDASMLSAMITGDRTWLQRRTRIGFERTGSFHLLVVSGLHLAIFAGLIFWLSQRIGLSRLWASLVTVAAALSYAVFTGFGQPVQRSFWMVTLYLVARLLWRDRAPLNAIGFAALCLLAANPLSLFDAGFQMTLLLSSLLREWPRLSRRAPSPHIFAPRATSH